MDKLSKEKLGYYDKGVIQKRGIYLHTPSLFARNNLLHVLWGSKLECTYPYELKRLNPTAYKNIYSFIYLFI